MGSGIEMIDCDLTNFDHLSDTEARRLGVLPANVCVTVRHPPGRPVRGAVIVNSLGWSIVGSELAACVQQKCGDDVELVEIPIYTQEGLPLAKRFFIINPLRALDVISETKTVRARTLIGSSRPVLRLAIIASKVPEDVHIFRVLGWRFALLIDDVIKNALSKFSRDGLTFLPVEQE